MDISWGDILSDAKVDIRQKKESLVIAMAVFSTQCRSTSPSANFATENFAGSSADYHAEVLIDSFRKRHPVPHSANASRSSPRFGENLDMGLSLVISFFINFIEINLAVGLGSIIAHLARITSSKVCQVYISFFLMFKLENESRLSNYAFDQIKRVFP